MSAEDTPEHWLRTAASLRAAGRVPEAIAAYERLLALEPGLPDSWFNLGWLRRRAGHYGAALAAYQEALERGVGGAEEVHLNRAVILSDHLARPDDAMVELQRALALNPRYVPAWLNLGNLHEDRGERDRAEAAYRQVLALDPSNTLALARLPGLRRLASADDPLLAALRRALLRPGLPATERADLGFALGKALDDIGAYDEAFAAYSAANRASRESAPPPGVRYDAAAQERMIDALIRAFAQRAPADDAAPASPSVFVCGMFRSGSTLVEQILAAQPRLAGGGELDLLPALVRNGQAPLDAAQLQADPARLQALRQAYRSGVRSLFPGAERVIDKRPDNFLYIGLIKTLFPDATIVHTRRHVLDNCLSIFFLHLGHAMPYALDLRDIAHWYGQYRRLMAHWKALYGDEILDLDYDVLVTEPRPSIERLLQHCGLPWDEACLDFHRSKQAVKTASVWQVRQPLYRRSSGRWQHYERHLGPLRRALAQHHVL